ncbi:MAG TPA: thrombospondin type 3 repeat-containing protein, partial [Kofleriaceae bacterium]|nr:thrombospondin type 3 repeat-containing protein [Kofleriaceae bacterium]
AGFLYIGSGMYRPDRKAQPAIAEAALRDLALGHPLTYTCVPPGSGLRLAVDRDGDGFWDGDERAAGSDPADAASVPGGTTVTAAR